MSTLAHNAVRTSLAAALLLLGMASFSLGYDSQSFIRQSVRTSWTTDDGLPQNSVQAILQTSDGYLWLGTQEGLVRFNGAKFTVFNKTNIDAIKSHDVRVLFEDRDHNMWVGTVGGGVMQYREGKFHTYTTKDGLRDNTITAIRQDSKGDLWFGTRIGLDRFQQGHFVHIDLPEGPQDISVNALAVDANGDIWVGTNNGLKRIPQNGAPTVMVEQPNTKIQALYADSSGDLWIGTERLGLYRISSGKLTHYSFPDVSILSIIENAGGLWIGTAGGGICQFASQGEQKPECYGSQDGLIGRTVLSILKDHEGSLWVGTPTGGLTQFRKGAFTTLDQSVPFIPSARSIYQAHDGSILVATDEGVKRYKDGESTSDLIKNGPGNNLAWSVIEARNGAIWVGTDHSGLKEIVNNRVVKTYTSKNGLVDDRVYAVREDHTGAIWAGTQGGVSRLKNGKITNFTTKDGLSSNYVFSIFEDSGHNLWFGTYGSLNRFQNGKFINATQDKSLAINNVSYFYEDSDHILWMGTAGEGLKRLKDGKFTSYTSNDGLFDDTVWAILEGGDHKFWMSSNRGIFEVAKSELNAFAERQISHINSKSYSPADGASAECNGGSQNPGLKTNDGRLLFACVKGVIVISPGKFSYNKNPPPVMIEQVLYNDHELNDHAEIPPQNWGKLEFHFAALNYLAPGRVQYKYKLEPLNKDWTSTSQHEIYYTNLAPGGYRFQVIASNEDGVWNDVGAAFSFYLKPHFYQTTWFYLLWVLSAVLAGAGMYLWRARKIRERQEELVRQVDERTAELQQQISKRQEIEQEMARTAAIVESSSDAIWSTDLRGTVITWNSGAEKLFGYSTEEMIGHSVLVIVPPERNEEVLQHFQKLRRGESVAGFETIRRAKSGKLLDLSLTLSTIWKEGTIIGISVIARDISERKRAEEALQQAKEAAEAATRAKSEFLANMSHEIRTPLNGVIGMLDLANRSGLSPEQNELLAMAQGSADTLLVVINDILDFSKVEAGKLQLDFAGFDLAEIVSEAVRTVALRAYEKRLELATHISPDFPRSLLGDSNRLRQVLINLLGNAIKFTEHGQVALRVEPERLNGEELELKFSIRDTGIGIPHEKQGMIFEPFIQADASTTRKYGGTGLGLPISARIVALMGGRIWVESEPGEGSTFYFTAVFKFAAERVGAGKIENGHRVRGKESAHQSRILKIMVAEDNVVNQKLVVRFLEQAGHQPVVANTGKEALKMWHEDSFDAILMDVQMPEMDGLAATSAIRAAEKVLARPHVPIIAMTAHAMKGDRERCLAAGMDAYLAKPIVLRDLLDSITRAAQNTAYQPS